MRFANPDFILFFAVLFSLALFFIWSFRSRKRALRKFAGQESLEELLKFSSLRRKKLKAFLLFLAAAFCLLALARPQWGFRWQEIKRKALDIIIALDTSKSMLAKDILPSRLQRAKLALRDLVRSLRADRIGLIAFAGSAFLQCPLTSDYSGFLLSLENIDTEIIPLGGTSLSSAIKEAMRSFSGTEKKRKVLVIISDGEDHQGDPIALAEEAKKQGIIIFCIGIGTKEGDLIPVENESGQKFLKDKEGNVVKSRLDEAILEKVALITGGSYIRATNIEFGLSPLYRDRLSKMEKEVQETKMAKRYEERFQIPLAIALLLLILEPFISEAKG